MNERLARPLDEPLIPCFELSTETVADKDQFELWYDFIAPIADVRLPDGSGKGFRSRVKLHDFGAMHLTLVETDDVIFDRTSSLIRKYGIDHWALNFLDGGNLEVRPEAQPHAETGEMRLVSFGRPFSGLVGGSGVSCMYLSRDGFADMAELLDSMIDRNLSGPMGGLLRDFMVSIGARADSLSASEAPTITAAFAQLLKAVMMPNAETLDQARIPIAATQFDMARRIIEANLKSPDLCADMLCARLSVSRRQLYYVFEPYGGVSKFITQRRLAACYTVLAQQGEKQPISAVAFEHGFTNLSSFYRQFQARYGFSPGETRTAWLNGHRADRARGETFADWLLRTGET